MVILEKDKLEFARIIATEPQVSATRTMLALRPQYSYAVANVMASKWLAMPMVQAEVARLREAGSRKAALSIEEMHQFLRDVVLTPIGKVGIDSPLSEEVTETTSEHGTTRKVKMPSKVKALQLSAMLSGAFAPVKSEQTVIHNIGSLLSSLMYGQPLIIEDTTEDNTEDFTDLI